MPFSTVFDQLFTVWAAIAGGVFVLVTGIVLVAVLINRAKRRRKLPFRASENKPVELGYVVVLAGIVAALFYGSYQANSALNHGKGLAAETTTPAARIDVTAYRWCWDFAYQSAPVTVTGTCTTNDFPTVVVPAGQPVEFNLTSRDVVHAFWLPDFAAKRDAYPDHVNTLRMVFPEEGRWRGRCSEYCGTHHVTMDFYVRAVSPAEYQQYLDSGGAAV
ncbi:cytochrome c oxidase subunit 2 [Halopolyspora algeriensis]|uniref:cytochrome-c oxidase n=1 Tax=Halopolyspora algeriensis TaxID=1500506 RepID=A0A368VXK6_9ACTN|nr:cytochrome c oxidase subunit II [Halopolyspora algeriensis]RCW46090.1 cytochrome c oxidase subunit 2 [Halopolyspora algeriensis]TQM55495.1 cytochrome c oxidase subunit 2 [Halopolyspora algeriensis]